jgi:hypothetical protein
MLKAPYCREIYTYVCDDADMNEGMTFGATPFPLHRSVLIEYVELDTYLGT